jgi:hypothetical protein
MRTSVQPSSCAISRRDLTPCRGPEENIESCERYCAHVGIKAEQTFLRCPRHFRFFDYFCPIDFEPRHEHLLTPFFFSRSGRRQVLGTMGRFGRMARRCDFRKRGICIAGSLQLQKQVQQMTASQSKPEQKNKARPGIWRCSISAGDASFCPGQRG